MQLWSGVFGLDGDLRPPLAAPEVEEGGGGGGSKQVRELRLWSLLGGCSPLCSLELHTADSTALFCRSSASNCSSTSSFFSPSSDAEPLFSIHYMLVLFPYSYLCVTDYLVNMLTPQSAN